MPFVELITFMMCGQVPALMAFAHTMNDCHEVLRYELDLCSQSPSVASNVTTLPSASSRTVTKLPGIVYPPAGNFTV